MERGHTLSRVWQEEHETVGKVMTTALLLCAWVVGGAVVAVSVVFFGLWFWLFSNPSSCWLIVQMQHVPLVLA